MFWIKCLVFRCILSLRILICFDMPLTGFFGLGSMLEMYGTHARFMYHLSMVNARNASNLKPDSKDTLFPLHFPQTLLAWTSLMEML